MARRKKLNSHYDLAISRASSLRSIDPNLDLSNGLLLSSYEQQIADLRNKLDDYNMHLSLVDEKLNIVLASEKALKDLSERMLAGVAAKFGKGSDEYEKAGGKKKTERKRMPKKA